MTTAALERIPSHNGTSGRLGQATAVEQSRAVAEVEAAIVVAMRHPRDVSRADRDMRRSCAHDTLAQKAFFRYSRGGQQITGPSVQLARELARCWGNIQYGIAEMRRDDDFGQSEMMAFAWDVETNARASTTFVVPHLRDKRTGPERLTDMRDIYENNANNGARRLREMIFAILPGWYTEAAVAACYETLNGDARDLPQRIEACVSGFAQRAISQEQLEQKVGAPRSAWTAGDLATLQVIWRSLMRGETTREDEFGAGPAPVTMAEILAQPPHTPAPKAGQSPADPGDEANPPPSAPVTSRQAGKPALDKLANITAQLELDETEQDTVIAWLAGGEWTASTSQVRNVAGVLEDFLKAAGGDVAAARAAMWARYEEVTGGGDE
ncbi:MAG TPA: hypothetical protein VNH17_05010 [Streptosporangiaceae bacterium]|nr:hypothetical protein [Streptosporangiaceae bacterium]